MRIFHSGMQGCTGRNGPDTLAMQRVIAHGHAPDGHTKTFCISSSVQARSTWKLTSWMSSLVACKTALGGSAQTPRACRAQSGRGMR